MRDEDKALYERLRQVRDRLGISQDAVAKKLGIDQSTYSKKERGQCAITITELREICDYFEISADAILSPQHALVSHTFWASLPTSPGQRKDVLTALEVLFGLLSAKNREAEKE